MQKSGRGELGCEDMKGRLFHDFILHYEAGSRQGSAVLCGRAADCPAPGLTYTQLIADNLVKRKRQDQADIITHMIKGFAILELICVNLFLYPWRKEIRTLKKFTGNFVYFVEPVIPEKTVQQILQRVGYSVVRETEYIIGGTINTEEAKLAAFELYLARLHCDKLLRDNRSDCANLLLSELSLENSEQRLKGSSLVTNSEQIDGTNNVNPENKISQEIHGRESEKSMVGIDLPLTDQALALDSNYFYSRYLDSDEFLNKYSDLNIALQPIFPLQNRRININPPQELKEEPKGLFEEPHFAKAYNPESSITEPDLYKDGDKVYNVLAEDTDTRAAVFIPNTLDSKKALGPNKSPIEMNMPSKHTQSERLVIKLKMGKMADKEMGYPVEETSPPDPKEFTYGSNFCQRDPHWTFLKNKEEEVTGSASFSSGFSMLNNKGAECGGVDSLHRLREPPSSMYIPPGGTKRQCLKITDLQLEDNHYQAPSPPGDVVQVNETLYKVHEDTNEDFVMITKKLQT
ncbi:uncharacterized protein [Pyxicephalus adspersus]|uniref:uncharacterized protein n=1 Tax=Pyxicephalus adspersus TaxID=30357 RepID=UPI003B59C546